MINSYYDDIELNYNMFIAEQELYDNLISLGASVYNESAGLILIQEDYKNSINKYIDKIVTGIQNAWDTFKNKVVQFVTKPIVDRAKKKIGSYKENSVKAEYWHKYNMEKFDSIKLPEFNLEEMKKYQTKIEYYKAAFTAIFVDPNKSLKENIIDQVIDTEDVHEVTSKDINDIFAFVTSGFKEKVTKLENNLKQFNANVNTLKMKVNVTTPGTEETKATTVQQQTTTTTTNAPSGSGEATKESVDMLLGIYEAYNIFNEAGPNDKDNTKTQKATNTETSKSDNKDETNNVKRIAWYLSGNTEIISAKMKILRQKYLDSVNILKIAFPVEKEEENKEENKEEKKEGNKYKLKVNI